MSDGSTLYIIALFIVLSAFFSSSETALFSLSKIQQKKLENSGKKGDKRILKLLANPRYLLITILLGNTLVNMSISSFATLYALHIKNTWHINISDSTLVIIQIIVTTIVILIFGEIVPKLLAWAKSYPVAYYVTIPLQIIGFILYPLLKVLELVSRLISKKHSFTENEEITSEELHTLIHSQHSMHTLEEHEKQIIAGLFRLPKAEISEILVPRVDVIAIEDSATLQEVQTMIISSGYSRIPVYHNNIDEIVGIVYAKDMLLHPEKKNISDLMRPAWFVTENMKIQSLLNQFKSKKIQIAVVVNEYGGTSGIITLEDIMEELVGEIHDEYDTDETPEIETISENEILVSGMCSIRELDNVFNLNIDPDAYDNIAEFLLEHFSHVPRINEVMLYNDEIEFRIADSNKRRINKVRITRLQPTANVEE